jgi:hypothetical protein
MEYYQLVNKHIQEKKEIHLDSENKFSELTSFVGEESPELRPEEFPEELWRWVEGRRKPQLKAVYASYPKDRLREVIELVYKIKICKKGERKLEEPAFRALMFANIDSIFNIDDDNPKMLKDLECAIELKDNEPAITKWNQKWSILENLYLKWKIEDLIGKKKLEISTSPWKHPIVLVPYPDRIREYLLRYGDRAQENLVAGVDLALILRLYRFTIDLRLLNAKTIPIHFPLPRVSGVLNSVKGCNHLSSADQNDAYWATRLAPESRAYTAFTAGGKHVQWTVMPQGFINASAIFQKFANNAFGD